MDLYGKDDLYRQDLVNQVLAGNKIAAARTGGYYVGALLGAGVCLHGAIGAVSRVMKRADDKPVDWQRIAVRCGEAVAGGIGFAAMLSKAQSAPRCL